MVDNGLHAIYDAAMIDMTMTAEDYFVAIKKARLRARDAWHTVEAELKNDVAAVDRVWRIHNGDMPLPSEKQAVPVVSLIDSANGHSQPVEENNAPQANGTSEDAPISKKERIRRVLPRVNGEIVDSAKVTAALKEFYPDMPDIDTPVISKVLRKFKDEGYLELITSSDRGRGLTTYKKTPLFYEAYG